MAIDRYRAEFSLDEMDIIESKEVEELISNSQEPITDPVDWMEIDQILRGNVMVDSITRIRRAKNNSDTIFALSVAPKAGKLSMNLKLA